MAPLSRLTVAVLSGLLCVSCSRSPEPAPAQPQAASPVPAPVCQVLELVERFGVSHPTQIVDFDLPAPLAGPDVRVLDGEGQEVCGQLLDGGRRIALMTDLPAGQSRSWTMYAGQRPAAFEGGIAVTETPEQYEIANGLVGVRVPGPPTAPPALDALPAPVQGVCMRDGTWAATGPNRLAAEASTLVAMTTRFLERGPLRVVVEVAYAFERPEYRYGQTHVADAGPGYYRSTLTVEAGQPVILFEEDTDMDLSYSMDFHAAVHPTHARYRGHHARATEYGAEPDGRVYRASHERPALDAEVELRYDRPMHSSYGSSPDSWRWMAVWDPWVFDSGWYWQAFDAAAAADGNLLGIFAGRASRAIGAHFSGVGLYTLPAPEGGQPQAGLTVQSHRRGADGRVARRSRWQWGLFAGVKGEDLRDATEVQPIARLANVHAGFGLNKLHRVGLDFADPAAGWGAMYMPPDAVQAMIERLRNDPEFHRRAYDTVTYTRPLIDAWCDATGAKREAVLEQLAADAGDLLRRHVEGDGAMDFHVHYWHGSLRMSRAAAWLDSLLAAPDLMGEQRQRCKAILALYAAVVWDDDVVPLFEGHGLNLGTANMPVQYQGVRDLYALMLARHPMMRGRAEGVWQRAQATVHETINEHGAHMGCTHYIGAANGPLLSILQQLKMSGLADPFKEEPRLRQYAEFEMNFLTPPDPRVGRRARPAIGDAEPVETTEFLGQLATAYADLDPGLSARLMGAWRQSGRPHSDFHGATILKIDERLPDRDPALASAHFEGWHSVLRFGWGTPNETAAWFVNGGWYRDHASNDLGEVVIYALGAPLSLDFGSMYSPISPGGFVHSVALPESAIGADWRQNPPDIRLGPRWGAPRTVEFKSLEREAWSTASFAMGGNRWTRTVKVAMLRDDLPVIGIRDELAVEGDAPGVFLLNLMADGEVATAGGARRVGDAFPLPAGVSRLGFTGQRFERHASQGIDWDLYVVAGAPVEAFLAQWEHANRGGERQPILRLKGAGRFQVVIVPRAKGAPAPEVRVEATDGGATASAGGVSARF